jgi:hypothetical protein
MPGWLHIYPLIIGLIYPALFSTPRGVQSPAAYWQLELAFFTGIFFSSMPHRYLFYFWVSSMCQEQLLAISKLEVVFKPTQTHTKFT